MMEKAKKTKIIIGLSYLVLLTIFVLLFFFQNLVSKKLLLMTSLKKIDCIF